MAPDGPSLPALLLLGSGWTAYFTGHSLLASLPVKRWVAGRYPALMPAYRLVFNGAATLLLVPVLWLMYALRGPWIWSWEGPVWWLGNGLAVLALAGFAWSLRFYDGSEFLGTRQWRARERSLLDQERLRLSPLHRYVRHPWYSLGLVLVWTRDMDAATLLSAVLVTAYFVLGSWLEERKLLVYYGPAYAQYRRRVPALVPLPWRSLSVAEAKALEAAASGPQRLQQE
ncbi:MAG: hypothetical protein MUF66_05045 [Gammaproteobacteria bacterium]|jgi:protein-S-isoprenylcysteine O-methyltransferase Ste14|nr:hypothetical protein [Gammaproteobacteria bacterium]